MAPSTGTSTVGTKHLVGLMALIGIYHGTPHGIEVPMLSLANTILWPDLMPVPLSSHGTGTFNVSHHHHFGLL